MTRPNLRIVTLGTAVGAVCGIYLYGVLAPPAPSSTPVLTSSERPTATVSAATPTRYADCVPPAVLEGQECVTRVEQVIAVPVDAPLSQAPRAQAQPERNGTPARPAATPAAAAQHEAAGHARESAEHQSAEHQSAEHESAEHARESAEHHDDEHRDGSSGSERESDR